KPFVILLSKSTHILMRVLGFKQLMDQTVTEEDIQAILLEGSSSGVIEQHEHAMVRNVTRLYDRSISSLMVPRSDIIYLDIALPLKLNYQRVMQSPHSRFPVTNGQLDELIGVVNSKELLAQAITDDVVDLAKLVTPCNFVPESLTGMELLDYFRSSNTQLVFVVGEYGDVKGLVTLHDLMEALTGEFYSEEPDNLFVVEREDGSLLLDGLLPILELKDVLKIQDLPDEGHYHTLNGLIMQIVGRVPDTGDKVSLGSWELEIVDMDGRRVDKVIATNIPTTRDEDDDG